MAIKHFTDDHPAAPTFTPPELPKRVHVRGATGNHYCFRFLKPIYFNRIKQKVKIVYKLITFVMVYHRTYFLP